MDGDKAAWEYADFAATSRKLKAITEDESIRREMQKFLQDSAGSAPGALDLGVSSEGESDRQGAACRAL